MIKNILYLVLVIGLFAGCKKKDITPSWIRIDKFNLTTNEATQGSNSHAIKDAWVYMDGQPLGVFELPCVFPVIDEGTHDFIIFAGIQDNGINKTRVRYAFYKSYELTAELVIGDTLLVEPSITYKDNVKIAFLEDFEDAGISLVKGPTSDTDMVFVDKADYPEIVKYGNKCGALFLTASDSIYTGATQSYMDLPIGEEVYFEIDYRNNNSLAMGVIATYYDGTTSEHTPLTIMNPQTDGSEIWKKLYIPLSLDVGYEINASSFEFYFLGVLDATNALAKIYVDNIKVVHYQ